MGFWDKLKGLFGGGKPQGDPAPDEQGEQDEAPAPAVTKRNRRASNRTWRLNKRGGTLVLIAPHGTFAVKGLTDAARAQLAKVAEGAEVVCEGEYEDGGTIEHLVVTNIDANTLPLQRGVPLAPSVTARPWSAPPPIAIAADDADEDDEDDEDDDAVDDKPPARSYEEEQALRWRNDEVLGLSPAEFRKRALRINPYQTAWIGRVDTIPPQSDERTALIDRGLILRGLLTEAQIAEIHRIGDQWLKHHDAIKLAEAVAHRSAEAAVEAERERKRQLKAKKKQEAIEREAQRRKDVATRKATDIVFAGRGVSGRLHDRRPHIEELAKHGLPVLGAPADVAKALGLSIPRLRWLTFHAEATMKTHYVYFEIPKRNGGRRLLAAPHEDLSKTQRWILDNILAKLEVTQHAHGFVADRSTVTNARLHVKKAIVVNLDLADFFPTITFPRVRGLFESIGYSPAASTLLALLVTEPPRVQVFHDGIPYWVAAGDRALPQGACTSPTISNLVTRKLDRRLAGACAKLGWTYSRYADDLTFSTNDKSNMSLMMSRVRAIVRDEGFKVNEAKGRVQRAARRQQVTGIVVNDKLGVPREELRRLRAIFHRAKTTGLAAQNRGKRPDFDAYLRGKIAYIAMIDRAKGDALLAELEKLAP